MMSPFLLFSPGVRMGSGGGAPPPPVPTGFAVTGTTETTATVEWTFAVDPTEWTLQYRISGDWLDSPENVAPADRLATITGLLPGTTYEFRLQADGGTWVETSDNTEPVEAPSWSGANPAGTGTEITIEWERSENPDSFVAQYRESGGSWSGDTVLGSAERSYEYTGLTPDTLYEFRVAAILGAYQSDWINGSSYSTPIAPSSVSVTGSETDIGGSYSDSGISGTFGYIVFYNSSPIDSGTDSTGFVNVAGSYELDNSCGFEVWRRSSHYPLGLDSTHVNVNSTIQP